MYGVYVVDDDEMFVMNTKEVWNYLQENDSGLFQNYSVHTDDGNKVLVYEPTAGANGKIDEVDIDEFFHGYTEQGIIIRKISKH